MSRRWKIAGINFDHFHMGDNLRYAAELPNVEIVGLCHRDRSTMQEAIAKFGITDERVFTDPRACLEATKPDLVIACPATADHATWAELLLEYGVHVMMEKPMASSLAEADRMIAAASKAQRTLAINWPMIWYAPHRTAYRLIGEGRIGQVTQVHYYGGNRGPLWHSADKVEKTATQVAAEKPTSWFYQRASGGGSLLDYLGYGTTLGSWFNGGQKPIEVTAVVDQPAGLEVDEHAIVVARYATGLSKFETRWGTFTDPWTNQPQPKCGFVIVGDSGTLSCYDYEPAIRLQTHADPAGQAITVDTLQLHERNPVAYMLDCLTQNCELTGPMSLQTSRIGQQIVDTAVASAAQKRTLPLLA